MCVINLGYIQLIILFFFTIYAIQLNNSNSNNVREL